MLASTLSRPRWAMPMTTSSMPLFAEPCRNASSTSDHVSTNWSPLLPLLAAADATSRLRLCPLVLNNDFHHPVHLARDGSEGLALLRQLRPAAAIVDLMMPGMSGLELIRAAREDPSLAAISIIAYLSLRKQKDMQWNA